TRGQLRAESIDVLRVYAKQRLVAGKGIGMVHARLITGRGTHTSLPGGNAALGVASALRAQGCEILRQTGRLAAVHLSLRLTGQHGQEYTAQLPVHIHAPSSGPTATGSLAARAIHFRKSAILRETAANSTDDYIKTQRLYAPVRPLQTGRLPPSDP